MKKLTSAICATGTLVVATPAIAQQVTATDTTGMPLQEMIHKSTANTPQGLADNVQVVYGSTTQPGWNSTNVTFIGGDLAGDLSGFTVGDLSATNAEAVHEEENSGGYAALSDGGTSGTPSLWSLIINPDELFSDMKFSIQFSGGGAFDIYYLLSGGGGWSNLDKDGNPIHFTINNSADSKYLVDVTGGLFDAIEIAADDPPDTNGSITEVKQISINPEAVPEPATWALMLVGFCGIGWAARRRRKAGTIPQLA